MTDALAANAERYDRSAEFPWDSIHAVHEAGLLTLGIGPAYGGRDLSATEAARVLQALGRGDPSVALLTAMTVFQHVSQARRPRWPEPLYRQVVRDSRQRPVLINAVRAEPEWGAPARGGLPATKLTRTARGWLLNGHKGYGTGSEGLAYHLVWAVTEDDEPLIGHVIVPGDSPGIKVVRTWDHLGLRASSTHDIVYTDVEVPFENFPGVPVAEAGRDAAAFASVGISLMALYVGVARAAQQFFITFANERVPTSLGRPIAATERIQTIAGEIEAQLIQAEEVLYGLAGRIDAGDPQALPAGRDRQAAHHPVGDQRRPDGVHGTGKPGPDPRQPPRAALPRHPVLPHPPAPGRRRPHRRRPPHPSRLSDVTSAPPTEPHPAG